MIAVHFGAGNIGRGFIGQLLHEAKYHVTFVDVNKTVVNALNEKKQYNVILADDSQQVDLITDVSAINSQENPEQVIAAILETELVTTAVGPTILPFIAKTLVVAIKARTAIQKPLIIMACENMIGASASLQERVYAELTDAEKKYADEFVSFPNAAVDRIVPNQTHDDPLTVLVEPFYEWVVEKSAIKGAAPDVPGITYVADLTPYIERKLFTVNTGHAVTAYIGHMKNIDSIEAAIHNDKVLFAVRSALEETGALLEKKFDFAHKEHQAYIDKIIERFKNPHISDYVSRVGRSPMRKLGPNDRFVQPARQFVEAFNETPKALADAIAAALRFNDPDDTEAVELQALVAAVGLEKAIADVTGIESYSKLFEKVKDSYLKLA
ncbi:mannitol-1-phosphate 5-dehydrogenase [Listeria newyorkensis]|uniref:Mannitol-1-phosphate 5-dehydrogenase n=1 Tax=Listeria newyorkensis TaxID=1497681 RepID=A0ABX4XS33_9LIST|nr:MULTISPECIES: mannitol-1-phosphate 5-dehydrogenase [Listeria]KGL39664.1 mannitol-1-phosphate 5-dehydrogenase [Listeriaceae bacterium FSL A5-0209]KGL43998.1 mannitol-1-phosphate 5-dehydrogenase [Listeria newyorkensis]KMT57991.1 mannitol-1-phosphate 5-dehydrogenase [Listeria newyorkensis]PNP94872.1 mannitol-1-phosphate 5-dehydrogenase [Listeria newyorkensis]RQW67206.1 mannitol-1-phosphate 5-dehydrogenase [Listeria sp. SHR_NRA_18]